MQRSLSVHEGIDPSTAGLARLKFSVLSSGSGGNSVYIEADGKRILIDAGLSEKKLSQRMAHIDRSLNGLDAVFATHEHSDHIRGMGPLLRRHQLPLYTTEGTYNRARHSLGTLPSFNQIRAGQPVEFGELVVEPYATPHDAEESVAFVIHFRGLRLGLATDLGKVTGLNFRGNKLTDVSGLEKLTQLTVLQLRANNLTDVKVLEKLTKLEHLDLTKNPDLTKAQIAELQKALPKCKISGNPKK